MRTTLTLDPDVDRAIARLRKQRGIPLRDVVNQALRLGLLHLEHTDTAPQTVSTRSMDLGPCKIPNLDDISETLAIAEGERFP